VKNDFEKPSPEVDFRNFIMGSRDFRKWMKLEI